MFYCNSAVAYRMLQRTIHDVGGNEYDEVFLLERKKGKEKCIGVVRLEGINKLYMEYDGLK